MKNKLFTLLLAVIAIFSLVACVDTGTTNKPTNPENGEETQNPTGSETKENSVKIKSIDAQETSVVQATYAKAKMRQNRNSGDDTNNSADEFNYIIITRPQTDITFTITLDNPEAYGIDALRVYCDDEDAQIQVDGEYKPIAQESDGTRVVNWSSEDPYTKTYNIRTTSEDAINSFKVVDVRLAGHDKFQSKETNSTDLGNNELHIYKMDEDAYTLNVIENTFDYIKFNFNIKDEYKDIISNIRVDGLEMDEELGYWMLEESKDVSVTYDYYLEEYDLKVNREDKEWVERLEVILNDESYDIFYPYDIFDPTTSEDGLMISGRTDILPIAADRRVLAIFININMPHKLYYKNIEIPFLTTLQLLSINNGNTIYVSNYEFLSDLYVEEETLRDVIYGNNNVTKEDIDLVMSNFTIEICGKKYIFEYNIIDDDGTGYYGFTYAIKITGLIGIGGK